MTAPPPVTAAVLAAREAARADNIARLHGPTAAARYVARGVGA